MGQFMWTKNELIDEFNAIENDIFDVARASDTDPHSLSVVINRINEFAKLANIHITGLIEESGDYDSLLKSRMKYTLVELVSSILGLMQILETQKIILGKNDEELSVLIQKVTELLRFEIISQPQKNVGDISIQSVFGDLAQLSGGNKDYYVINHLYQNSCWRFLPRFHIDDVAIVMQGPFAKDNDFTLETLIRYRYIYPEVVIILSTWEGEVDELTAWKLGIFKIILLENKMPKDTGFVNVKLQLTSSRVGIQKAKEIGKTKYVIKTRTDQRLFLPDFLMLMRSSIHNYKCNQSGMKERILFLGGAHSFCTCPFQLTDFLTFGNIEDVEHFYSASGDSKRFVKGDTSDINYLVYRSKNILERSHDDSFQAIFSMNRAAKIKLARELVSVLDPETYLSLTFYESYILGREITDSDDTLALYWNFLKKGVIIIDSDQLLLYWYKYDNKYYNENSLISNGGLTNSAWLQFMDLDEGID